MNIEKGELFVVTRGYEFGDSSFINAAFFGVPVSTQPKHQNWDRSHEGCVYKALEICGPVIAAECVFYTGYEMRDFPKLGRKVSLNTTEVEVWPVTPEYLASLKPVNPNPIMSERNRHA